MTLWMHEVMDNLKVSLKNCYGIRALDYEFDVSSGNGARRKPQVCAVYAPNGLMKSSFAKTFEALSKGDVPKEERYGRVSECEVSTGGVAVESEVIYVLKAEIDINSDTSAITDILVSPDHKARYDELLVELDSLKKKLIAALQQASKVKKSDVEQRLLEDWGGSDFSTCIGLALKETVDHDYAPYAYETLFNQKAQDVIRGQDFASHATEFNERYQSLFEKDGTIYQKGVFNPARADESFSTLKKKGFFNGGHRVHLKDDEQSLGQEELEEKLKAINESIDADEILKKLRGRLAKNAQVLALTDLIESLSLSDVEFLLEQLKPENSISFRKALWSYYIQNDSSASAFYDSYQVNKEELLRIERAAAETAPRWYRAVELFNERFVDMPFSLSVENHAQAALGKEQARLRFTFSDGEDVKECARSEAKLTLSQGEKRALYLLGFIFEVEARRISEQKTLFIIDDVADSFDYKNKHAIIQYLEDLGEEELFHQIILTHNFDFFRSLANSFVPYDRCLMASRSGESICIQRAEGIRNYFIGKWKEHVNDSDKILCATVPFVRNLIEYTKGEDDADFLLLTSLLHWKPGTGRLTVGQYLDAYNRVFGSEYSTTDQTPYLEVLCAAADEICGQEQHDGLNLEDKVALSMAIRMKSEIYMTNELRTLKNDDDYWCRRENQFGALVKEYSSLVPDSPSLRVLEKVSITVSSNIHLNSFMYEPILDLTIDHLIRLYAEVQALDAPHQAA